MGNSVAAACEDLRVLPAFGSFNKRKVARRAADVIVDRLSHSMVHLGRFVASADSSMC